MTTTNATTLDDLPTDVIRARFARGTLEQKRRIAAGLEVVARRRSWVPLPHQIPPAGTDWYLWLLLGGRGTGKTDGSAEYVARHVKGPACAHVPGGHRVAIIAPTLGDAVDSCVNGPSGLKAHDPDVRLVSAPGGMLVRWPSGAEAKLFGARAPDDVERLRAGGNRCLVWAEELAAWSQLGDAWTHMRFGLRLGDRPHIVASTTPKPRALIRELVTDPSTRLSHATTHDNPHLHPAVRAALEDAYGGTRLGRQELLGELLDDLDGALWNRENITRSSGAPRLTRIAIGIDPSTWGPETGASHETVGKGIETGMVVVGMSDETPVRCYVLDDLSGRWSPEEWGSRAVGAWRHWSATCPTVIVPETNAGGAMVVHTVRSVDRAAQIYTNAKGRAGVHAAKGKRARAEPVAALYEQGRVLHVGQFPTLEDQMCGWDPSEAWSPDRIDALVWAVTALAPWSGGQAHTSGALAHRRLPSVQLVGLPR